MNSFVLQFDEENVHKETKSAVSEVFEFYREKELILSRFSAVRTVGSLQAKK